MRENRTHGSIGGRWRHGDDLRGLLVPDRCANKRTTMVWSGPQPQRITRRASGLPHRCRLGVGGWIDVESASDLGQ